jgi:hypothetical protein
MISYAVVIERADDGGYGAWCPDLPGCVVGTRPAQPTPVLRAFDQPMRETMPA